MIKSLNEIYEEQKVGSKSNFFIGMENSFFELKDIKINKIHWNGVNSKRFVKKMFDDELHHFENVRSLIKKILTGIELYPIILDTNYALLDGFHRVCAYSILKEDKTKAYIKLKEYEDGR